MSHRSRLSLGAESLLAQLHEQRHDERDCDVLVVGSGYGGAVAAARLAGNVGEDGAPIALWVVERGREYLPGMFPTRWSELPADVRFSRGDGRPARGYAEALFDLRLGGDARVLLGNGLGGGSLINAGVMARAAETVWHSGWPAALDRLGVEAGYLKAERMLQPERIPDKPPKLQVLEQLAGAAPQTDLRCPVTINFKAPRDSAAGVPLQTCTRCGDCLSGCNQGAKGSLDTNYLALAAQRKARLFCGVTVQRLVAPQRPGEAWQVLCQTTEPSLRPAAGRQPFVVRARRVILAAGALGSTEILLRSQAAGLDCSARLGQRFSTNGDMVAAVFRHRQQVQATAEQETDPADPQARGVGPTITGLAAVQAQGQAFVVEEFAVPAALSSLFGEIVSTFCLPGLHDAMEHNPDPAEDPLAATGRTLTHSGLYGFIGDDGAQGRIEWVPPAPGQPEPADASVRVRWPALAGLPLFDAQMRWLKEACARADGPGGHPVHNPGWRPFGDALQGLNERPDPGAPLTVHPLGGCPMGDGATDGVVDHAGRVFRADGGLHDGLAVLDGAIVPRALGINPALTIAALAEQALPELRNAWGLREPPVPAEEALPPGPPPMARRPEKRGPTAVRISESLQGRLDIGGRRCWARLQLAFEPIADLGDMLRAADKAVALRSATLALYEAPADCDEFSAEPGPQLAAARLSGRLGLLVPVAGRRSCLLRYELKVDSVDPAATAGPLKAGQALLGVKKLAKGSGSLVRQLSEVVLSIDGSEVGMLSLDMNDLVDREEALLAITRQSSMPDALADLAGLASLTLRHFFYGQFNALQRYGDYDDALIRQNLAQRLPAALRNGVVPVVQRLGAHGARLSRYAPGGVPKGRPVLLIHGYGASGTTFTHASIPCSLAQYLVDEGREAWVLDLRTSIGNEPDDPDQPRAGPWPFDTVAHEDITQAVEYVAAACGGRVDVVAHCIGAAMFCVAALDMPRLHEHVGAVVLSQVAPLLRMSPANRLRGFLASYLEQFIGADELDVRHEYRRVRGADGQIAWARDAGRADAMRLVDMLLASFPYDDAELKREAAVVKRTGIDMRSVRRRSDAIWGHLMELDNVADETWAHLDAINGWVKLRSLAQTIHYARHGLLTDAAGHNRALRQERLQANFGFPVLLLHGQRNRVFDWRGSHAAFRLLAPLRGIDAAQAPQPRGDLLHWGGDGSVQLLVAKAYGHQDCIVGKTAHQDLFPQLLGFLDAQAAKPALPPPPAELPIEFEPPWIGPLVGVPAPDPDGLHWRLTLLAHPSPRRARTIGLVLVPIGADGEPMFGLARGLLPEAVAAPRQIGADAATDHTEALRDRGVSLRLERRSVPAEVPGFAVLAVHSDLALAPEQLFRSTTTLRYTATAFFERLVKRLPAGWLEGGLPLNAAAARALAAQWPALQKAGRLRHARLQLGQAVFDAADQPDGPRQPLCFALASCQYPPGLFDTEVAGASFARLAADCEAPAPPQFLLAVGDQVYLDATAGVFDPGLGAAAAERFQRAYELNRRLPAFRDAAARLPLASMLDDHEVRDNWQPQPPLDAEAQQALALFARHQALLNPAPLRPGAWHFGFRPAGALVLVLDTRSQRELRRVDAASPGEALETARLVPEAVMREVCRQLKEADPRAAKFVVSPVPLLPAERIDPAAPAARLRSDGWPGYPRSMFELLAFIRDHDIRRVVLLSGDAHASAVVKLALDGGPEVFGVMSSGLYAPWPFDHARPEQFVLEGPLTLRHEGQALQGTMHRGAWSADNGYARIALEAEGDDAHAWLTVALCGATGSTLRCRHDLRGGAAGGWITTP